MTFYTTTTRDARRVRHRANVARSADYLEFRGRDAKAIDQGEFVDRLPDQPPRLHAEVIADTEAGLTRLAAALRQVGDDARPSAV